MQYGGSTDVKILPKGTPKVILSDASFQDFSLLDRKFYDESAKFLMSHKFHHVGDVRRIDRRCGGLGLDRNTLCRLLCDPSGTVLCRLYDAAWTPWRYFFFKAFGIDAGYVIEFSFMLESGISLAAVNVSRRAAAARKKTEYFYHANFPHFLPGSRIEDFCRDFRRIMCELAIANIGQKFMHQRLVDVSRLDNIVWMMQCMYSSTHYKYDCDVFEEPFVFPGLEQQLSNIDLDGLCRRVGG